MDRLPHGVRPLETQVAGHTFQPNTEALGMLQDTNDGCVLKPLGKPHCEKRELQFYYALEKAQDPVLKQLKPLVPIFYKKLKLTVHNREFTFVKLEDLTHGLRKPCIIDIKIGKRTWDPEATPEKRAVEEEKYVKCKKSLGLCIPGLQVYPLDDGEVQRFGKEYGKKLDADGFRKTIILFLNANSTVCVPLIQAVLDQLYAISDWFNIQRIYNFYASSLLISYDAASLKNCMESMHNRRTNGSADVENGVESLRANGTATTDPTATTYRTPWVKVKMIDFAHVFPAENQSLDTNYLFGLKNLITIIEDLLN